MRLVTGAWISHNLSANQSVNPRISNRFSVVSQFEFDMLERSSAIGAWQNPYKGGAQGREGAC
jgi:hypothetical protein